ncbi:hypothetical protein EV683_102142 [Crenobacter luteus]|nr:hypothetical protein [Crenobacter luteus]TCP15224.1 hypothetical protein EV683_102142 [Crenobacter luteus]
MIAIASKDKPPPFARQAAHPEQDAFAASGRPMPAAPLPPVTF